MAEESKGVALAILGIVAVIAVVGLVLLFTGRTTGSAIEFPGVPKVYPGQVLQGNTGQGFNTYGNRKYAFNDQTGTCEDSEFFSQKPLDLAACRPASVRVEIYHRDFKQFPTVPDTVVATNGFCCPLPESRGTGGEYAAEQYKPANYQRP
jgi:hypothetical protein